MNELPRTPQLERLLILFEEIGGVVEYVVLQNDRESPNQTECHSQAALSTMGTLSQRLDLYFERLMQSEEYKQRDRSEFLRIHVDPELLIGREISLTEFLGPYFDLDTRRLILRGQSPEHVNNDFYAGDAENWDNVIKSENIVVPASVGPELSNLGYAYAFSAPPYSLSALNIEINNLFLSIAEEIFCGFRCPVRIYQWSTCCSNYFDEGSEYWGSFLWTFEPLGSNTIVGIAASTTD